MINIQNNAGIIYHIDPHTSPWKTEVEPLILALGTWDEYESPFGLFQYGEISNDSYQRFNLADIPTEPTYEDIGWNEWNLQARNEMIQGNFHFERDCGLWQEALGALVIRGDITIPENVTFQYEVWW